VARFGRQQVQQVTLSRRRAAAQFDRHGQVAVDRQQRALQAQRIVGHEAVRQRTAAPTHIERPVVGCRRPLAHRVGRRAVKRQQHQRAAIEQAIQHLRRLRTSRCIGRRAGRARGKAPALRRIGTAQALHLGADAVLGDRRDGVGQRARPLMGDGLLAGGLGFGGGFGYGGGRHGADCRSGLGAMGHAPCQVRKQMQPRLDAVQRNLLAPRADAIGALAARTVHRCEGMTAGLSAGRSTFGMRFASPGPRQTA
jgi:hypothetical protein